MRIKTFSRTMARVICSALASAFLAASAVQAHEVQPVVMDMTIGAETVKISADWMIETAISGLDLTDLQNTAEAQNDSEYDRLRALQPDQLAEAVKAAWPRFVSQLELSTGGERLPLTLEDIEAGDVGNLEIARLSTLRLSAPLPPGDAPLEFRAAPELGPFVVRLAGVESGYAEFLAPGMSSGAIPRTGGEDQTASAAFVDYVAVGFDHIVPKGLDHILFVLGLFFLSTRMGPLLWQVSAFTLAHTVTLALGALGIVRIPPSVVEPLIAASIVYVGVENVFLRNLSPWRPFVVFGFGLLHGLGFASVLMNFGLGGTNFVPKLVGFNVGVEVGQLAVIAAAWLALNFFFGRYEWYHRRIAAPVSVAVAIIAAFWVLERTGIVGTDGPWALFSALTEGGFNPILVTATAVILAAGLAGIQMLSVTMQKFRAFAGMLTSFIMFLSLVAAFTSGAWTMCVVAALAWVLALRVHSLAGRYQAVAQILCDFASTRK
ncbi:HupE/UreJ family protein [Defluviimonas sp. WL0002]|uniref:HupE/UreJ family protein n=1 Tax=Albidovulum marisflavi TaxID=2984159 RepID=A0ABT2Z8N7_9RHOB|nr:HupE/UreJ family protein [Defluviimonas sp. WL0002]MCV2867461.1 HupE/UreJ family protein [Defluviimonas sp. WL0002]